MKHFPIIFSTFLIFQSVFAGAGIPSGEVSGKVNVGGIVYDTVDHNYVPVRACSYSYTKLPSGIYEFHINITTSKSELKDDIVVRSPYYVDDGGNFTNLTDTTNPEATLSPAATHDTFTIPPKAPFNATYDGHRSLKNEAQASKVPNDYDVHFTFELLSPNYSTVKVVTIVVRNGSNPNDSPVEIYTCEFAPAPNLAKR